MNEKRFDTGSVTLNYLEYGTPFQDKGQTPVLEAMKAFLGSVQM